MRIVRLPVFVIALLVLLIAAACGRLPVPGAEQPSETYRGTPFEGVAPDFRLVDHRGTRVALSDFRGKAVVLAFMDTRCDETCPLTAAELRSVHRDLDSAAGEVVFLGVNTNADNATVEDAAAFSASQRLTDIPSWLFLTGPPEELQPVWRDYRIAVVAQPGEEDYDHTPGVFLIDRQGKWRWYVSIPLSEEGLIAPWEGPGLAELVLGHVRALLEEPG